MNESVITDYEPFFFSNESPKNGLKALKIKLMCFYFQT